MDVKTTLLNGDLKENAFKSQPKCLFSKEKRIKDMETCQILICPKEEQIPGMRS